jgi:hypothetical protein
MEDTCPYLQTLREWLGKVIECENCSYLFAHLLAFHRGISVRPEVPFTPIGLLRLCLLCLLCLFCALQPPSSAVVAPSPVVAARCFLTTMAGKS